jgi:hypothetical protein
MSTIQPIESASRLSWPSICEHFGLDPSFQYSDQQREEYYAEMEASSSEPQHLPFEVFKKFATVIPLKNHGRVADVVMGGRSFGFVDHLGEEGLRQAHRAKVNNALYLHSPDAQDVVHNVPLPSPAVLAEYPDLRARFPEAAQKVDDLDRASASADATVQVGKFLELLTQADEVCVDDSPRGTRWTTSPMTGEPDNQVVHFSWEDEKRQLYSVTLTEAGIGVGKWVETSFFCEDVDGEDTQISMYKAMPIVP